MKIHRPLTIAALIGCTMVAASGAAFAQNTCESGYLTGVIDEDIVISGPLASCDIQNATVNGDVIADGADLGMNFVDVSGEISALNGDTAVIYGSTATRIRVVGNTAAIVIANGANERLVVRNNDIARVKHNLAVDLISCRNNTNFEASYNTVGPLGIERCNRSGN